MNMMDKNFLILCNKYLKQIEDYQGDAVMITIGSGPRVFSSGFDLKYWKKKKGNDTLTIKLLHVLLARLLTCNVPTLCCINGFAVAGGVLLSLAHD